MPSDRSLDELYAFLPRRNEPADFDAFWERMLAPIWRQHPPVTFTAVETGLRLVETLAVCYHGDGGEPLTGWLLLPRQRFAPLPCVVEFGDYGAGLCLLERLMWSNAGFAHFVVTPRHQPVPVWGGGSCAGEGEEGTVAGGWATQGIMNPETYYYRQVFLDGVRAVQAVRTHPAVDAGRVALTGRGQGGGMALAVAGLDAGVYAVLPDAPGLCLFAQALEEASEGPYHELARFCARHPERRATVLATLEYFDCLHFAWRSHQPAFFTAGLVDASNPPPAVFAAYNIYAGTKQMCVAAEGRYRTGEVIYAQIRFLNGLLSGG